MGLIWREYDLSQSGNISLIEYDISPIEYDFYMISQKFKISEILTQYKHSSIASIDPK
jgi:hypothetical protein